MDAQATKSEILNWVQNIKDVRLLKSLMSLKQSYSSNNWWEELTPEEKRDIELGEEDLKQGRTLSDQEFWKNYE